jgi:hypothetical protein
VFCSPRYSIFSLLPTFSFFILFLVQEQSQKRPLVLISGFIHDVGSFIDEHPGGPHLLIKMIGKDATTAFFGGVYNHSNAAHNLLAMKHVGVLHGIVILYLALYYLFRNLIQGIFFPRLYFALYYFSLVIYGILYRASCMDHFDLTRPFTHSSRN